MGRELLHCRTCVFTVIALRLKTASGGLDKARRQWQEEQEAMQLVVCGMRRSVRLEEPEQSLDRAGQHGPQRGEGVSGPRPHRRVRARILRTHSSSWRTGEEYCRGAASAVGGAHAEAGAERAESSTAGGSTA